MEAPGWDHGHPGAFVLGMPATKIIAQVSNSRSVDRTLTALLVIQALTLFVALPLNELGQRGRLLVSICHLAFGILSLGMLTRHPVIRGVLLLGILILAAGPVADRQIAVHSGLSLMAIHDAVAGAAFAFDAVISVLVFRCVFAPGPVTSQQVQGGVLLYLNVAALFAIAFGVLESHLPGSFVTGDAKSLTLTLTTRTAALSYFSLSTITSAGYGDVVPHLPMPRSLAMIEATFGQLYPATLLARLVGLRLSSGEERVLAVSVKAPKRRLRYRTKGLSNV